MTFYKFAITIICDFTGRQSVDSVFEGNLAVCGPGDSAG